MESKCIYVNKTPNLTRELRCQNKSNQHIQVLAAAMSPNPKPCPRLSIPTRPPMSARRNRTSRHYRSCQNTFRAILSDNDFLALSRTWDNGIHGSFPTRGNPICVYIYICISMLKKRVLIIEALQNVHRFTNFGQPPICIDP